MNLRTILAFALVGVGVQQLASVTGQGFVFTDETRAAIRMRGLVLVGAGAAVFLWGRRLGL